MLNQLILLTFIVLSGASCLTTSKNRVKSGFEPESMYITNLSPEESKDLFDSLTLTTGPNSGSSRRMTSLKGILYCDHSATGKLKCLVRSRIGSFPYLSEKQDTKDDLADDFLKKMHTVRPKLTAAKALVANVDCDYMGPAVPPYKAESTRCELSYPRHVDETFILDAAATDLTQSLLLSGTNNKVGGEWSGFLKCRGTTAATSTCTIAGGELKSGTEKLLASNLSQAVVASVQKTWEEKWALENRVKDQPFAMPQQLELNVECEVKNIKTKTGNEPMRLCRLRP